MKTLNEAEEISQSKAYKLTTAEMETRKLLNITKKKESGRADVHCKGSRERKWKKRITKECVQAIYIELKGMNSQIEWAYQELRIDTKKHIKLHHYE